VSQCQLAFDGADALVLVRPKGSALTLDWQQGLLIDQIVQPPPKSGVMPEINVTTLQVQE
ncbi:MAG: hypothetical protein MO852_14390, partial [Candidatus Devosia euplotis]|nr:hypothetical protein [Candidatus Devosia euplotis]